VIADPAEREPRVRLPWIVDSAETFRKAYDARGGAAYLIRPDGYVGYRTDAVEPEKLEAALRRVFGCQ
jgi:hypothetical protein